MEWVSSIIRFISTNKSLLVNGCKKIISMISAFIRRKQYRYQLYLDSLISPSTIFIENLYEYLKKCNIEYNKYNYCGISKQHIYYIKSILKSLNYERPFVSGNIKNALKSYVPEDEIIIINQCSINQTVSGFEYNLHIDSSIHIGGYQYSDHIVFNRIIFKSIIPKLISSI